MYEHGYISQEDLQTSIKKPIDFNKKKNGSFAKYFTDEIFRFISSRISEEVFFKSGLSIVSTMEKKFQIAAEKSLENGLIAHEHRQEYRGKLCHENNSSLHLQVQVLKIIEKMIPKTINEIYPVVIKKVTKHFYECINSRTEEIKLTKEINIFKNVPTFEEDDIIFVRKLENSDFELYQEPKATGGIIVYCPNILAMSLR